jgi:hypothetical protein
MMDPHYMRFVANGSAERIVELLSEQQYLQPHQRVGQAVGAAREKAGFCAGAAERALEILRIDPAQSVGRLRRSELVQLARTIYRLWRQNAAAGAEQSQPA